MEIIKLDQVTGILSNSNKGKPDFESLKFLISLLLFFFFTKLNACCVIA